MKKILAFVLASAMTLSLAACSSGNDAYLVATAPPTAIPLMKRRLSVSLLPAKIRVSTLWLPSTSVN